MTASVSCAEATSITVEIATDLACDQSSKIEVGIAAGDLATIDRRPFSATKSWCEPTPGRIGSLVLLPSDRDDAEVAVHVVAGIGRPASTCAEDFAGCIVERRVVRFVPHANVVLPVLISAACVGIQCGSQRTCREGLCVDVTSVTGPADAGVPRGAGPDADKVVDASPPKDAAAAPNDAAPVCAPVSGATACCQQGVACVGDAAVCAVPSQCAKCVAKCGGDPDRTRCCVGTKIDGDGLPRVTCKRPSDAC